MSAHDLDKLTASPHWEWRPGMRDLSSVFGPRVIVDVSLTGLIYSAHERDCGVAQTTSVRTADAFTRPDLDHGGTQGEMVHLVRKAWGGRVEILVLPDGSANVQVYAGRRHFFKGDHLGLALAAAILAAPPKAGEP